MEGVVKKSTNVVDTVERKMNFAQSKYYFVMVTKFVLHIVRGLINIQKKTRMISIIRIWKNISNGIEKKEILLHSYPLHWERIFRFWFISIFWEQQYNCIANWNQKYHTAD